MSIAEKTLLIVDDMKTIRVKLKQICGDIGITKVHEAEDGKEAIDILKREKIDLILSDWNMPRMTGIEMVDEIRKDPALVKIPIIFITLEAEKSAILKSLISGVTDYIVKPFPDHIVKQKIFNALKMTGG